MCLRPHRSSMLQGEEGGWEGEEGGYHIEGV